MQEIQYTKDNFTQLCAAPGGFERWKNPTKRRQTARFFAGPSGGQILFLVSIEPGEEIELPAIWRYAVRMTAAEANRRAHSPKPDIAPELDCVMSGVMPELQRVGAHNPRLHSALIDRSNAPRRRT